MSGGGHVRGDYVQGKCPDPSPEHTAVAAAAAATTYIVHPLRRLLQIADALSAKRTATLTSVFQ